MNVFETLFEVIDMRSFSNLWYWIGLAVFWSTASRYVVGVPIELAQRARRAGGSIMQDFEDLARIQTNRILDFVEVSGMISTVIVSTALTCLVLLGFVYDVEFCQAVFLMAAPMTVVGLFNLGAAKRIKSENPDGETLYKILRNQRYKTQALGVVSIFVTAMWGMYQNIVSGVLGG